MNEAGTKRAGASIGAMGAALAALAALEIAWGSGSSLLVVLVFWLSLIEGSIALVAAGELCNSKWLEHVKRPLLGVYPLILVVAVLFLLILLRLRIYPWTGGGNAWLHPEFFIGRNIVLLVLAFAAARRFAASSIGNAANRKTPAVAYLLVFVASQSLVAFDWVMSLEYPWVSTLFGGYFFVEALYAGTALSALYIVRARIPVGGAVNVLRDAATVLFGLSLLWAGLFYAQFLVIWYGNLPEERGFIFRRVYMPPYGALARLILLAVFVLPFAVLLSRRAKSSTRITAFLAAAILAGMLLEKILLIHPPAPVPSFPTVLEFLCMGAVFMLALRRSEARSSAE